MVVATQTRRRETPMSHYQHLTISERESIWENKLAGKSLREIARQTGRSVSTISRAKSTGPLRRKRNMSGAGNAAAEKSSCKKENSKIWSFVC